MLVNYQWIYTGQNILIRNLASPEKGGLTETLKANIAHLETPITALGLREAGRCLMSHVVTVGLHARFHLSQSSTSLSTAADAMKETSRKNPKDQVQEMTLIDTLVMTDQEKDIQEMIQGSDTLEMTLGKDLPGTIQGRGIHVTDHESNIQEKTGHAPGTLEKIQDRLLITIHQKDQIQNFREGRTVSIRMALKNSMHP